MVRGNWQKRVEKAQARREESKQRKQTSHDKKNHKQWIIDFVKLLDRHSDAILRQQSKSKQQGCLHFWATTLSSDGPPLLDLVEEERGGGGGGSGGKKTKKRSGSIEEYAITNATGAGSSGGGGGGGGLRTVGKGSAPYNKSKKKPHPARRNKDSVATPKVVNANNDDNHSNEKVEPQEDVVLPLASRSHFFRSKGENAMSTFTADVMGTNTTTANSNFARPNVTLAQVLLSKPQSSSSSSSAPPPSHDSNSNRTAFTSKSIEVLDAAESAMEESIPPDQELSNPGAMEMLYHGVVSLVELMALVRTTALTATTTATTTATATATEDDAELEALEDNEEPENSVVTPAAAAATAATTTTITTATTNCNTIGQAWSRRFLSSKQIPLTSIVYVVLNDTLVYDRNQEGTIVSDDVFLEQALGVASTIRSRRTVSLGGEDDTNVAVGEDEYDDDDDDEDDEEHDEELRKLLALPGSILDHILTFLPDAAVAMASQVCRDWRREIGGTPHLWSHLLERRNWPTSYSPATATSSPTELRDVFLRHYAAMRDILGLQSAMKAMRKTMAPLATIPRGEHRFPGELAATRNNPDMVFYDFSKLKHAPQSPNVCVSIQIWSSRRVLAAYSHDCSVRLFEVVAVAGGEDDDEKRCKELVCQYIDPFRYTKRRTCQLLCMEIDEASIGCLCSVTTEDGPKVTYILVVVSRDEFLLGESSTRITNTRTDSNSPWTVIDIGEAFVNYILSCDEIVGDRMQELYDLLTVDGGDVTEVGINVAHTMVCSGGGRFMVEVTIYIPAADDDGPVVMELLDKMLVLFSTQSGAIVWIGESDPLDEGSRRPRQEGISMAYLRRSPHGGSRPSCTIAVASFSSFPSLLVGEIDFAGRVHEPQRLYVAETVWARSLSPGWQILRAPYERPGIVTPSDIVTGDTIVRMENDEIRGWRGVISFLPRIPHGEAAPLVRTLFLEDMEIIRLGSLRDDHIVVFCRCHKSFQMPLQNNIGNNEVLGDGDGDEDHDGNDIQGEWFGVAANHDIQQTPTANVSVYSIVIDSNTGQEIARVCLVNNSSHLSDIPQITTAHNQLNGSDGKEMGLIGFGLSCHGVVLTGKNVRTVVSSSFESGSRDDTPSKSAVKKKKAKGRAKKGGKKDAFARGLSLRG